MTSRMQCIAQKTPSISRRKPEPLLDSSETVFLRLQTHAVGFHLSFPSFLIKPAFQKDCVDQSIARKQNKVSDAFNVAGSYFMKIILPNSILDSLPSERNAFCERCQIKRNSVTSSTCLMKAKADFFQISSD